MGKAKFYLKTLRIHFKARKVLWKTLVFGFSV